MTCWRRLRDWNNAGVWQRLHEVLLDELRAAGRLDLSRTVIDSYVRALKGGPKPDGARSTATGRARDPSGADERGVDQMLGQEPGLQFPGPDHL